MKTELLHRSKSDIAKAGALLREGAVVAIPTETVYGLAANALDEAAVLRIFEAKGRPQDNPLIVHISALDQLEEALGEYPKEIFEQSMRQGDVRVCLVRNVEEEYSVHLPPGCGGGRNQRGLPDHQRHSAAPAGKAFERSRCEAAESEP